MSFVLFNYFIPIQSNVIPATSCTFPFTYFGFWHKIQRRWKKRKKIRLITRCGRKWTGSWSSLGSGRRWHGWRRQPGLCLHIHRWVWHCGMLLSAICNTHHRNTLVYFPEHTPSDKNLKANTRSEPFQHLLWKITPDYLLQCALPKLHHLNVT